MLLMGLQYLSTLGIRLVQLQGLMDIRLSRRPRASLHHSLSSHPFPSPSLRKVFPSLQYIYIRQATVSSRTPRTRRPHPLAACAAATAAATSTTGTAVNARTSPTAHHALVTLANLPVRPSPQGPSLRPKTSTHWVASSRSSATWW